MIFQETPRMNLGDSVHDASRSYKPLQDIQDIVDKLAAVTRQLGGPDRSTPGGITLSAETAKQAEAVCRIEGSGAQQREGADVPGDVRLALQVDAAG
jgi:hypothetical protein